MMWTFGKSSDVEGLRLMVAFFQIADPEVRAALIEAAELAARKSAQQAIPILELPQDNFPASERAGDL